MRAGRKATPGLDQIVFTLPATTALSCFVTIQVRAGGVLSNAVTIATATGDACPATPAIRINEVESNGGTPGDWVELYNPGPGPANLAGFVFKDNDDTHSYTLPATAVSRRAATSCSKRRDFGFGLGAPDAARLFRPDGTLADSYSWTPHAATTYGRCPNGTGAFTTTTSSTKGAANDCGSPGEDQRSRVDGGTPGDWVELYQPGAAPVDLSGFVFRDNDDTHTYVIPAGTTHRRGRLPVSRRRRSASAWAAPTAPACSIRPAALIDSYTWTAHAATTYGRCPNGTGAFATTTASTKGAANACPGDVTFSPWPGGADVQTVDTRASSAAT